MLPLKLILDTNVIVSGALKSNGLERAVLVFSVTPPARLFVTEPIIAEYSRVLAKPILKIGPRNAADLLRLIGSRSKIVQPSKAIAVCHDPDDDKFVECADEVRADYLVTGNQRHFPKFWKNTKVINSRELIEIIAPHLKA